MTASFLQILRWIWHLVTLRCKFFRAFFLVSGTQFNFQNKYRCTHAIGKVTVAFEVIESPNAGNSGFNDLKQAFITLEHKISLENFKYSGYRGRVFFSDRPP